MKVKNMAAQVIHSDSVSATIEKRSESESEPRSDRTVIHLRMPHYLLFSLKRLGRSKRQGVTEIILDIFSEHVFGLKTVIPHIIAKKLQLSISDILEWTETNKGDIIVKKL